MPWCSSCRGSTNSGDEFGDEFGEPENSGREKFAEDKKIGEPKSNSGSQNQIQGAKIWLRLLSRRYKCASIVEDLSGAGAHMSLMGPGPGPGRKRARGRGRRRRRKTLPQSIQVPSFQHPGTSYPVRGTPQSDLQCSPNQYSSGESLI